ncbi:MAG: HAMP domain-containing sensor histidine kinase [Elusimicrobia bacterium]|nr:HAMP domain-containing sensor histidine kinase [Elusimicrobiota bacterium]
MKGFIRALDRGQVTNFSRNSYEVVFSIFMIALAWFYRENPLIVYPQVLYCFLALLGSNFVFNYLLRRRTAVNLWLIDLILLLNLWTITGILLFSGGGDSYFWVLYLLPVFAASLMASLKDAAGVVFLCGISLVVMSWPVSPDDLAGLLGLSAKIAVLASSSWVVFNTAQARKITEAGLAFKRAQVETLTRDIAEKETELVRTASSNEIGTLVSGVMHDLGNCVSVILLSLEIFSAEEKPSKSDLDRIVKAARFAKAMVANALGIVRGQEYLFEPVSLGEIAESAEMLTSYAARKAGATVELRIPADLPEIKASRVHLERIFINTILNSVSFLPQGGVVAISAGVDGDSLKVEIADNGPGFPAKVLEGGVKAFGTTRKEKGGTGLGLFVCEQIARRHGGRLKLDKAAGGGAMVRLILPLGGPAA